MVKHYNPSIVQRAQRILNTKMDNLSNEVKDEIVATIPLTPVVNFAKSIGSAGNLMSTPTDKDTYLTYASMSATKTAADTGTNATLSVPVEGGSPPVLQICGITLTALQDSVAISFNPPIKLDRGANVVLGGSNFTSLRGSVGGYYEETTAS